MSILEAQQEIQETLTTMGEQLNFPTYSIQGIVSFVTSDLFTGAVEQQIWQVEVASADTKLYSISVDDTFTYTTNEYRFTFQLDRPPIPYGDGWDRLAVLLISTLIL